jgi:hypothetical protein
MVGVNIRNRFWETEYTQGKGMEETGFGETVKERE